MVEVIKPVFEALSADDLLDHCLEGATQNQKESINAAVWGLCPKESLAGLNSVETACAMAVAHFNDGAHSSANILKKCGLNPGRYVSDAADNETANVSTTHRKNHGKVPWKQDRTGGQRESTRKK